MNHTAAVHFHLQNSVTIQGPEAGPGRIKRGQDTQAADMNDTTFNRLNKMMNLNTWHTTLNTTYVNISWQITASVGHRIVNILIRPKSFLANGSMRQVCAIRVKIADSHMIYWMKERYKSSCKKIRSFLRNDFLKKERQIWECTMSDIERKLSRRRHKILKV